MRFRYDGLVRVHLGTKKLSGLCHPIHEHIEDLGQDRLVLANRYGDEQLYQVEVLCHNLGRDSLTASFV